MAIHHRVLVRAGRASLWASAAAAWACLCGLALASAQPELQPGLQPGLPPEESGTLPQGLPEAAPSDVASISTGTQVPWPAVTVEQALAQPAPAPPDLDAWLLERIAQIDLRIRPAPAVDDFRMAMLAFDVAAEVRPDDANLLRRASEAAFTAGDPGALEAYTRRIVALDGRDTVAQLRLITMRIGRYQSAAERLAAYDRLLGPAGRSLDASVRSRLALDAAVLARETGDEDRFVEYLKQATALDATNKEAAALALAYFQAAVPEDAIGRLQLMMNLMLADPVDPHVNMGLVEELLANGAIQQAGRFHNNALAIVGAADPQIATLLEKRGLILMWHVQGPERVVEALNQRLGQLRHAAAVNVADLQRQGLAIREEQRPENTRLDREFELVRLMAADAAGLRDMAAASAADFTATATSVFEFYQRPENRPTGEAGQQLAQLIIDMWIETLVVRAWANADLPQLRDELRQTVENLGDRVNLDEPLAWFALRNGQPAEALEFFERTMGRLYRSRLGRAIALEQLGQREAATEAYADIARHDPTSVQSAWARSRVVFLTGQDLARTEFADEMSSIAESIPVAIDRMLRDPNEFMRMTLDATPERLAPLDIANVDLVLANRGSMPLGLGTDRPIESRLLLSPEARVGSRPVIGAVQPEVLDVEHRLRLERGDELHVPLYAENGFTAAFMDSQAASRTGVAWRVIQGFQITGGSYVRGPLCLSAATREVYREPLLLARLTPEDLVVAIRTCPEDMVPAACRAAYAVSLSTNYGLRCTTEQAAAMATALGERYGAADVATRRMMIAMVPSEPLVAGFGAFDDAVRSDISAQSDVRLLLLALLTRARTADDAIIEACRNSGDPRLFEAAAIQAARLEGEPTRVYATTGPGLGGFLGPVLPSLGVVGD
ncbi:MAG: hypothetical protein KDA05_08255 [Phycisphaerales bacterium]|nr:hypothetical protein [Phycisphaerales bacterium]